jgi:hypothetical protein
MKTLYLFLLIPSLAWGTGDKPPTSPPATADATATASAESAASSTSSATGGAATGGSASSSVEIDEETQAPAFAAPSVFPTAECLRAASFALSVKGGGVAFGGTAAMVECQKLILGDRYANIGMRSEACTAYNATETAKLIFGDALPSCRFAPAPEPEPICPTVVVLQGDSTASAERAERIFEKCVSK